jgi:predicted AlkP superfamily pyrophosphatase or phosphodiesterase
VCIVGIDGATWPVFDQFIDAGLMPNLQQIAGHGARGTLRSFDPTASAIIWTSIATGKGPDQHGIRSFVAPNRAGKIVPVTSNMRQTKAIWNIASESAITVGFIGWWATWPAEPVRGFLCSDYTWPLLKSDRGFAVGADDRSERSYRTYPDSLLEELDPFIRTEDRLAADALEELGLAAIPPTAGYAIRDIFLKDISYGDMAVHLMDEYQPSLFSVYFEGFDAFCHVFWPAVKDYLRARRDGEDAVQELPPQIRGLGRALDAHLARLDDYLGALRNRLRPDDVLIVISDHGYGDNPELKPIMRTYGEFITVPHWHTLDGIIAMQGGPIRNGQALSDCSVLDITPTVLALLGLPCGADMNGRPLVSAFTDEFKRDHPPRTIETWDAAGTRSGQGPQESPYDEAMMRRLRALGYLE